MTPLSLGPWRAASSTRAKPARPPPVCWPTARRNEAQRLRPRARRRDPAGVRLQQDCQAAFRAEADPTSACRRRGPRLTERPAPAAHRYPRRMTGPPPSTRRGRRPHPPPTARRDLRPHSQRPHRRRPSSASGHLPGTGAPARPRSAVDGRAGRLAASRGRIPAPGRARRDLHRPGPANQPRGRPSSWPRPMPVRSTHAESEGIRRVSQPDSTSHISGPGTRVRRTGSTGLTGRGGPSVSRCPGCRARSHAEVRPRTGKRP